MANWCLSCRNHKILELIFKGDTPAAPPLFWRRDIQPLLEELKKWLGGDNIPEDNDDEPIWIRLDSKDAIQVKQSRVIDSNVYQSKIKDYLMIVGVTPVPPPTGWLKQRREALPFSQRCNHKARGN